MATHSSILAWKSPWTEEADGPWGHKRWDMTEQLRSCANTENSDLPGLSGLKTKKSVCQCRRHRFYPWIGKIPWRREWQPTPVFLPGKPHGQSSQAGYSPWGRRVRDHWTTRQQLNHVRVLITLRWCVFIVGVTQNRQWKWPGPLRGQEDCLLHNLHTGKVLQGTALPRERAGGLWQEEPPR